MKLVVLFISCIFLISCGKNNQAALSEGQVAPLSADLAPGSYQISCFKNKLATQGIGTDIYTKATITLNNDGSGSNSFELYSDVGCINLLANGTTTLNTYQTVRVGGMQVLQMEQNDGFSVMNLWIPYKEVNAQYYLDVNFALDGQSGPYLAEPLESEMSDFMADPQVQGVLITPI